MNTLPVLYSFRRCPYAIRARLALASSRQAYELREVMLRQKPKSLLRLSPKGTVPVLVLPSGNVIEQSLDIMLWTLHNHDPERWLVPNHGTLSDMLALVADCDQSFKRSLDHCKYPSRYPGMDFAVARAHATLWLQSLDSRLSIHPYLFGTHATLADMAIAPFVRQFAGISDAQWSQQPWPRLQAWLATWQGGELFEGVMRSVPVWTEDATG